MPWLAALQGGVLYPPHPLYLLLPIPIAMGTLAAAHLALVAFGAFAFARRVGLVAPASLLVAVLCIVRPRLPALVYVPNMLEAAAWLAPGRLGVLGAVEGRWRRAVVWLGLAAGMSALAGYPQATAYCACLWAGLLAGSCWRGRCSGAERIRPRSRSAAACSSWPTRTIRAGARSSTTRRWRSIR